MAVLASRCRWFWEQLGLVSVDRSQTNVFPFEAEKQELGVRVAYTRFCSGNTHTKKLISKTYYGRLRQGLLGVRIRKLLGWPTPVYPKLSATSLENSESSCPLP